MYCRFCGKQISEDSAFCSHCGKQQGNAIAQPPLPSAPQPPPPQKQVTVEEPAVDPARALVGLKGWLGLFGLCIFIGIFITGYNLFTDLSLLSITLKSKYAPFFILDAMGVILILATQCAFFYAYLKEKKTAVVLAIAMLLISTALAFFEYSLVKAYLGQLQQPIPDDNALALQRSLSAAVIWIPYFLRSKRVKQTLIK